jgi:tRNA (mo5U34)-methyltransferase
MGDEPRPFTEEALRRELERLEPFHHEVALPFGLRTSGINENDRLRMTHLRENVWPELSLEGRRVLDVACCCGGVSLEAASRAEYVLGIDVVERYIEQAEFLKRALGRERVEFRRLAVEDVDPSLGTFDVSLCLGILYHLENPVLGMRRIADVTTSVIVVDSLLDPKHPYQPYWRMNIKGPRTSSENASTTLWRDGTVCQFMPSARAVEDLLRFLGFRSVKRLDPTRDIAYYRKGDWATFIGTR